MTQLPEIKAEELYKICNTKFEDIETSLKSIKKLIEHPEKFGLTIE